MENKNYFSKDLLKEITLTNSEETFRNFAEMFMNNYCLKVADKEYEFCEIEIYYNDKKNHNDPYVHSKEEQLNFGTWYFNGFGLDITIGNKEKNIHGGILIRGVKENGKYFNGPSIVLREIFSNFGEITNEDGIKFYIGQCNRKKEEKEEEKKYLQLNESGLLKRKMTKKTF